MNRKGIVDGLRKEGEKWSDLALVHHYALDIPLDRSSLCEEPNTCVLSGKVWLVAHKNRKHGATKLELSNSFFNLVTMYCISFIYIYYIYIIS